MKLIYLAAPYTSSSQQTQIDRVERASRVAASLMEDGLVVYSPITHGHHIQPHFTQPHSHDWWMEQCLPILRRCDALLVLTIPGWQQSKGVGEEILAARGSRLPVYYITEGSPVHFLLPSEMGAPPEVTEVPVLDFLRARFNRS